MLRIAAFASNVVASIREEEGRSRQGRYVLAVEASRARSQQRGLQPVLPQSSNEYLDVIEEVLFTIGCSKTAAITSDALSALNLQEPPTGPEAVMLSQDRAVSEAPRACDDRYCDENGEPIDDACWGDRGEPERGSGGWRLSDTGLRLASLRSPQVRPRGGGAVGKSQMPRFRETVNGVLVGGGLFVAIMLVFAAVLLGWVRQDGAHRVDLGPWLVVEAIGGSAASLAAGAVSRRIGRSCCAPVVLSAIALALGLLEGAEILRGIASGMPSGS